jgi:hypothetical protein
MSNEQDTEIKSIKARTVSLNLSDADADRLFKKAGQAGLSVSELLENFVGDLVGVYGNGSDERDYAEQWFDRCWFSAGCVWGAEDISFLQWLITEDCIDNAIELWNNIAFCKMDEAETLKQMEESGEAEDLADYRDDLKCLREEIADEREELNGLLTEYREEANCNKSATLEKEMEKVLQWNKERSEFKNTDTEGIKLESQQLRAVIMQSDPKFFNRKCRVCGCTWDHACEGGCSWVEDDLCSKCCESATNEESEEGMPEC